MGSCWSAHISFAVSTDGGLACLGRRFLTLDLEYLLGNNRGGWLRLGRVGGCDRGILVYRSRSYYGVEKLFSAGVTMK